MGRFSSLLGLSIGMTMLSEPSIGKSWNHRRSIIRNSNPIGFRNKPTKRREKVKAARKFNLKNRKNGR